MAAADLPDEPTIAHLTSYIRQVVADRGFANETLQDLFILLTEEVGELARVVRKQSGIKSDVTSKALDAEGELADILIYLLLIANKMNIDLEQAFREKEARNNKRTWQ